MKGVVVDEVGSKPKASALKSKPSIFTNVAKVVSAVSKVLTAATASPRIWVAVTCTLLVISGGARYWREGDFWGRQATAREAPFSLNDLPKEIGTWRMIEGSESILDPDVAWAPRPRRSWIVPRAVREHPRADTLMDQRDVPDGWNSELKGEAVEGCVRSRCDRRRPRTRIRGSGIDGA